MKKSIIILAILTVQISYAQRFELINHGSSYLEIKELSLYDFKDNCKGYYDGKMLNYAISDYYCNSKFPSYLSSKSYELGNKLKSDLRKIGNNFSSNSSRKLWSSFDQCSKKAYEYVQLHLQKFELISEYYKRLYNYNIDKGLEKEAVNSSMVDIEDSINFAKSDVRQKIMSDTELLKLISQKGKSIDKMVKDANAEINRLEAARKQKIGNLSITNYASNKEKINNEYQPKISKLKNEKRENVRSAELFWDDKIKGRKSVLIRQIEEETSLLESEITTVQLAQRKEMKKENNLALTREEIELDYQEALISIDIKINKLTGN